MAESAGASLWLFIAAQFLSRFANAFLATAVRFELLQVPRSPTDRTTPRALLKAPEPSPHTLLEMP